MKLLYTKINPASKNIADELRKISDLELTEFFKDVLDVPTNFKEEILVLSTHRTKTGEPILTVHVSGNWDSADFGGEKRTLNIAYGSLLKKLLIGLDKGNKKYNLGWKVCVECDHHGPTCKVPILFIEIGSSEKQWNNKTAGKIVAQAIKSALENKKEFETVFAIGEGHYAKNFTKFLLESDYAIGHILPKYKIKELDEDTFKQAIEKNVEKITKVIIDKECNRWQKDKIKELCKKFNLILEEV